MEKKATPIERDYALKIMDLYGDIEAHGFDRVAESRNDTVKLIVGEDNFKKLVEAVNFISDMESIVNKEIDRVYELTEGRDDWDT